MTNVWIHLVGVGRTTVAESMRGKLGLARLLLKYCSCSSNLNQIFRTRKMSNSVFVQKFNPATGQTEWQLQSEDYDYQQEVARAAFADMLHDEERVK